MTEFSSAQPTNYTYNRQSDIQKFHLNDRIRTDRQKMVLTTNPDYLDDSDLLTTNNLDASFTTENSVSTLPNNRLDTRYYQENYVLINISSRQRQEFNERAVIPEDRDIFPNKQIWDQFIDSETGNIIGDVDVCCITFNNILEFGQEFPYFFEKENQLWIRVPNDPNPNQFTVILRPERRHVRAIRLVSVEPPRGLDVINEVNNLLMLDVIDPCTNESIPWPDDLPFALTLIPIGSYTVDTLLERIIQLLNQLVEPYLEESNRVCKPFSYLYDLNTGQIDIIGEFLFHLRFWFSVSDPQYQLWKMLGYQFPYPRDEENQPAYVNVFSNLVSAPSALTDTGLVNYFPFSRPNLDIIEYIYLVVEGFDVIQDPQIITEQIFAKVLIKENRFISSTKIYTEPLDRLSKIRVKWIDQFGNLLNVKGQENSFLLEIIEYQDRLKDADFSSQRGIRNYDEEVNKVQHKQIVSIT